MKIVNLILILFCISFVSCSKQHYYKHNKLKKGKFSISTSNQHHSPLHYKTCNNVKKKHAKITKRNLKYPVYLGSGN